MQVSGIAANLHNITMSLHQCSRSLDDTFNGLTLKIGDVAYAHS